MNVKTTENKMTIEIEKSEYKDLFERVPVMNNPKAYFEYLLKLDFQLNGSDSEFIGYDNLEHYEYFARKWNLDKIKRVEKKIVKEILSSIDDLNDFIPEEYKFNTYDKRYTFISDDDLVSYLKYSADRLRILLRLDKALEKNNVNNNKEYNDIVNKVSSYVEEEANEEGK